MKFDVFSGEKDLPIFQDIRLLIDAAKSRVANVVHAEISLLYWHVGKRNQAEVLRGERADYGKLVIEKLALHLTEQYGRGWSARHLRYCVRFAEVFPSNEIMNTLCSKLSWSHIRLLMGMDDALKREFYIEMAALDRWSVRQLRGRINSMLYERTALSRKPDETISHDLEKLRKEDVMHTDMLLTDPYILDFLDLNDHYYEKDFEDAILRELEQFLLELGTGFAFVARQKRMPIDDEDFYLDLLFYNRKLKRLIAVDLKLGAFRHEFKSQMELYLKWLAKYEMEPSENPPLGIILCAGKQREQVELLEMDASGIHVAEYLTELPTRELLAAKLHESIANAKKRLGEP